MAEVFGFRIGDTSPEANRYRRSKLCPFNNKVPNCTKDKQKDPLGVCSIFEGECRIITCPIRFREDWIIATDAADFIFQPDARWTTLSEIRLKDKNGGAAGNIDHVLASYDHGGKILDFGALEVQAVYISGNVRNPFQHYMSDPTKHKNMDWTNEENFPRADFLSSSRKRLAPQLIYKGGILNAWGKKSVVALDKHFFATLPKIKGVKKEDAEIAWMIYDLNASGDRFKLKLVDKVFTKFAPSLLKITQSKPGKLEDFLESLQVKLDEKLDTSPTNEQLTSLR